MHTRSCGVHVTPFRPSWPLRDLALDPILALGLVNLRLDQSIYLSNASSPSVHNVDAATW